MGDLVAWLTATLDHIEQVANSSAGGEWTRGHHEAEASRIEGPNNLVIYDEGGHTPEDAAHIALHDPRAVLARVEAERAIVNLARHDWTTEVGVRVADAVGGLPGSEVFATLGVNAAEAVLTPILKALAYGHRYDHSGYRDEWAPVGASPTAST